MVLVILDITTFFLICNFYHFVQGKTDKLLFEPLANKQADEVVEKIKGQKLNRCLIDLSKKNHKISVQAGIQHQF